MSYDLGAKVISYLEKSGVSGSRVEDLTLILPSGTRHDLRGTVISKEKLNKIVEDYKAAEGD